MLKWLKNTIGDQAPAVGAITVLVALMSGYLGYTIVTDFGIGDAPNQPSEIQRDRR
jgi:hypothetical protein